MRSLKEQTGRSFLSYVFFCLVLQLDLPLVVSASCRNTICHTIASFEGRGLCNVARKGDDVELFPASKGFPSRKKEIYGSTAFSTFKVQ